MNKVLLSGLELAGDIQFLGGNEFLSFRILKMESWVKRLLTEHSQCNTLCSFSYTSDDEVLESSTAQITYLDSYNFYVQFMEG